MKILPIILEECKKEREKENQSFNAVLMTKVMMSLFASSIL